MKNFLRFIGLLAVVMSCSLGLYGQSSEITGKVLDQQGQPVIGATVVVVGTTVGTTTDVSGAYKIMVAKPQAASLSFSYIGLETTTLPVSGRKSIDVTLKGSSIAMEEVVAIGYGTMRRKDVTGSVASVSAQELAKVPVSSVTQALAGRMAGVNVMQSEGDINNSKVSIRVRGGISLTQDNDPLYVIDGFPCDATVFAALNPSDIETIDVLKDASASAIYGARAANGVVLITTKSGDVNKKTQVSYEGYVGFKSMTNEMELLSVTEYALLDYERSMANNQEKIAGFNQRFGSFAQIPSFGDPTSSNYRAGVNWQDEAFRQAVTHNNKITVSGGVKDTKFSLSYSHLDEDGILINSNLKKDVIRINLEHKISKSLSVNAQATYTSQKSSGMSTSEGAVRFSRMCSFLQYMPTMGLVMPDQTFRTIANMNTYDKDLLDETGNTLQNPAAAARAIDNIKTMNVFNASGGFTWEILPGLTFKNSEGLLWKGNRTDVFFGENSMEASRASINGTIRSSERQTFQTNNVLSYQNVFRKKHTLNVMVGQEYISEKYRWFEAGTTNFPNGDIGLDDMSLGLPAIPLSARERNDLVSFFARGYYNFNNRYMFTATARYDGSSKFGTNNKWGFFPSASFAWRASEEKFIKDLNIFSDLKVRVGYGKIGNDRIPNYSSLVIWASQGVPGNNSTMPGYYPKQIANPDLRWEANKTFNVGLDMGFFNGRLNISPEFYLNRSVDLLFNSTIPESSGYSSVLRNIGTSENKGVDLLISSVNISKPNFSWTTNLTLSHNKQKIIKLAGEQSFEQSSDFGYAQKDFLVQVGQSVGQIYGYVTDGLYKGSDFSSIAALDPVKGTYKYNLKDGVASRGDRAVPGYWKFKNLDGNATVDANGNPTITDADRTVIGNTTPKLYGGLNNTFLFKGFDFTVFMNFSWGNDVLNATKLGVSLFGQLNKNTLATNSSQARWMTVDPKTGAFLDRTNLQAIDKVNAGKTIASVEDMNAGQQVIHSWGVEDGSFLRINNLTLGYTFPSKWMKKARIERLRLYVSANNVCTITGYSGYDPEVSTRNSSGLTPGVDWSAFPRSRTYVFGINLSF